MKKFISFIITVIFCISLCACETTHTEPGLPELDVEQAIVNICCEYSNVDQLRVFDIGTCNKYPTENGYKVEAKGSYYPVDAYGSLQDAMLFDVEFTATWNERNDKYEIKVDDKWIRKRY